MDAQTLQRLLARTWPGLESGRVGEWELRAGAGFTDRANSALPLGHPGLPLPAALEAVQNWYRARGLPPRLQLPATLDETGPQPAPGVAEWCDDNGWSAEPWTLVMTGPIVPDATAAAPGRRAGPGPEGLTLHWSDQPDDAWLGLYHHRGATLPVQARRVITAAPARYLTARLDDEPVGIGRCATAGPLVALTAIEVLPQHRRRGYGAAITVALAGCGGAAGATTGALQVFAHNGPAVALYRRLGYRPHHRYRYRTAALG